MDTFDDHVPFEIAKMLKRLNFDWKERGYYNKLGFFSMGIPQNDEFPAPSLYVVQKWLRERCNLVISVWPHTCCRCVMAFNYSIDKNKEYFDPKDFFEIKDEHSCWYDTYEEALIAAITSCLEMLLLK